MHDSEGAKLIVPTLKNLKFSKKQIAYLQKMIKNHIYPSGVVTSDDSSEKAYLRFYRKMEDEVIDRLEAVLKETESVTTLLSKGYTPETMLHKMLDEFGLELGEEKMPASFSCNCSKERMEKALVSLGSREIQNIIDDGEKIEMKCHFCNSSYEFEVEELQNLLNDLKA